jgi:HD-GYP domain-containing protein (c-di-GMP phosphodiesterase class II)
MPASLLQVGMFVCRLDRPWLGTPFLMQGFLIENRAMLHEVQSLCSQVCIDTRKSLVRLKAKPAKIPAPANLPASFDRDMARMGLRSVLPAYSRTLKHVKAAMSSLKQGHPLNPELLGRDIDECITALIDNIPAITWLSRVKSHDDYTYEHALHVSLLSMVFGIHCGWPRDEVRTVGLAALLFDLGKLRIPKSLLNKPGPLTETEWQLFHEHPKWTRYLLEKSGFSQDVIAACYYHHERPDGQGYPVQKVAGQVPLGSRLIHILDAFDAMISYRPYAQQRTVYDAIRVLYKGRGTEFDAVLVDQFIELMGVYPVGTLVELNSGEVAVVIGQNHDARLLPRIALVRDRNKQPVDERIVNLKHLTGSDGIARFRIKTMLHDGSYGIFMRDYTRQLVLGNNTAH